MKANSSSEAPLKLVHPAWLRLLHWVHFYAIGVMVWSGLMIYWAYQAYSFQIFNQKIYVVPPALFDWLGIRFKLATGLAIHFNIMWVVMVCGVAYLVLGFVWGSLSYIVPTLADAKALLHMAAARMGLRKTFQQTGKYNPAQKLAYFTTIVAGIVLVLSGWAIYKPARLHWLTALFGGYKTARAFHFWTTYYMVFFFVIHVVQVVRAGWNNFASMVTGYTSTVPSTKSK